MLWINAEKPQLVNFFPEGESLLSMLILIKYQTISLKHTPGTMQETRQLICFLFIFFNGYKDKCIQIKR